MIKLSFSELPIKRKALVYISFCTILLLCVALMFTQTILKNQFKHLAINEIKQKFEMVRKLIESEVERLVQLNADWGAWDETYQFIQDGNEEYKKNNLIPSGLATLDVTFLIYFDVKGNIVYAGKYEPEKDTIITPDSQICLKIFYALFNERLREELIKGEITIFEGEPFIISAESILTSQHKGPLKGWLVMARKINFKPIMEMTALTIDISYEDSSQLCMLNDTEANMLNVNIGIDTIFASYKFYDVLNNRLLNLNVFEENKLSKQGNRASIYILLTIIISGLLIFHLSLIGLNHIVLNPISKISRQLKKIDLNNIETKIELPKTKDEIYSLAAEINNMLVVIERQKLNIIESEQRYRDLVENAEVGILIDDIEGNVVYFNEKLTRIFGYTPEEFRQLKVEDYIYPEDLKTIRLYHRQRIKQEEAPKIYELRGIHKNGKIINLEVNTLVLQKAGKIIGTRNYIVDITARKIIEEKLTAESILDELTGLFNRRGFNKLAEHQVNLSKKTGKGFYVFYCDLNNMKRLNDRYGHSTGDIMLKNVANLLKRSFRNSDIIARVGGDEFIVLATDAQPESIGVMLDRLKVNVEKFNQSNEYPEISLSVGYAYFYPDGSKTLDDIINSADKMMYEEKQKFKNKN